FSNSSLFHSRCLSQHNKTFPLCLSSVHFLQVSLRPKPNKRSRVGSIFVMSRRRISCKDLGNADCQGWMYKKKEKGAFLGNKWKKYWSVLKGSCLYWYTNQMVSCLILFLY
ncbi:hypothetical protein FKM82_030260, partial [Ascaphus truei]